MCQCILRYFIEHKGTRSRAYIGYCEVPIQYLKGMLCLVTTIETFDFYNWFDLFLVIDSDNNHKSFKKHDHKHPFSIWYVVTCKSFLYTPQYTS